MTTLAPAPVPLAVRFTRGKIGRITHVPDLPVTVHPDADGDPDWDRLCEDVEAYARRHLCSNDVRAVLGLLTTPEPGQPKYLGQVYVGGFRLVATWTLHAPVAFPRKDQP